MTSNLWEWQQFGTVRSRRSELSHLQKSTSQISEVTLGNLLSRVLTCFGGRRPPCRPDWFFTAACQKQTRQSWSRVQKNHLERVYYSLRVCRLLKTSSGSTSHLLINASLPTKLLIITQTSWASGHLRRRNEPLPVWDLRRVGEEDPGQSGLT